MFFSCKVDIAFFQLAHILSSFLYTNSLGILSVKSREGIIVPLYRRFVVYPGGAGVEEGASGEEGGPLPHRHPHNCLYWWGTFIHSRLSRRLYFSSLSWKWTMDFCSIFTIARVDVSSIKQKGEKYEGYFYLKCF